MARARKIAITVDPGLLREAEAAARITTESRSAVFARALRSLLRTEARRRDIERYIAVHQQEPETAEETDWIDRASVEAFAVLGERRRRRPGR
jgi:metal-responsive CopG/Arc/MetJ family transcriptional regulator